MTPQKPVSNADIEAAVRAELPWLLERSRAREAAASDDTVSGRLRRAVAAMKQPYEQVCQAPVFRFKTWQTSWPAAICLPMPLIGWRPLHTANLWRVTHETRTIESRCRRSDRRGSA